MSVVLSGARAFSRLYALSAVIRVYDEVGDVIETHAHSSDFKE